MTVLDGKSRWAAEALLQALVPQQEVISLPQLLALLSIALEPGICVNDLGRRLGWPQQTASRNVSALLGRYQSVSTDSPSTGSERLISQQINEDDPRRRALFLTESGEAIIKKLLSQIDFAAAQTRGTK